MEVGWGAHFRLERMISSWISGARSFQVTLGAADAEEAMSEYREVPLNGRVHRLKSNRHLRQNNNQESKKMAALHVPRIEMDGCKGNEVRQTSQVRPTVTRCVANSTSMSKRKRECVRMRAIGFASGQHAILRLRNGCCAVGT